MKRDKFFARINKFYYGPENLVVKFCVIIVNTEWTIESFLGGQHCRLIKPVKLVLKLINSYQISYYLK